MDGRFVVQVIVCAVPISQLAPADGPVTFSAGITMAKAAPRPLVGNGSFPVTRTTAEVVAAPATVQAKLPVLGAAAASVSKVSPPSRLNSMSIVASAGRLSVQVIVWADPTKATEPAPGPVTVTAGVMTLNAAVSPTATTGPLAVTRTSACALSGPLAIQLKLPVFGTPAATVWNETPPSRLTSTNTVALAGRLSVQLIATGVPA